MTSDAAVSGDGRGLRYWIGTLAGMFLGGVLLFASWAKMIDPGAFMDLIELEGLDFLAPSWLVAPVGLAIEAGLGMALLLNVRRWWVLLPTAALCLFFMYLTGRAYAAYLAGESDPAASCGCFGNLVERTPTEAFWGDLFLLIPALVLSFLGRPTGAGFPRIRMEIVAVTVLMVLGFAWKAPDLPLDDMATRLKPGVKLAELCAGEGEQKTCLGDLAPEVMEGRHVMLIADLDNLAFRYSVVGLGDLDATNEDVGFLVLTSAEPDEIKAFSWDTGPTFEIRHVPAALLRPLYRHRPRTAVVQDGTVVKTYDGLPPAELFAPSGAEEDGDG